MLINYSVNNNSQPQVLGGVSVQSLFDNHNTWRPDGTQGDLEERKGTKCRTFINISPEFQKLITNIKRKAINKDAGLQFTSSAVKNL